MEKKDYGSSNRRKFLIGAGSVAAGGSALLGTAATTTFNLNDRAVSANVVTDSSGAVALTDTEDPGNIINLTSGELEIDFTEGGASGVNIGSVVEVGDFSGLNSSGTNDAAFTITNQTTDTLNLDVQFVAGSSFNAVASGSELTFRFVNVDNDGSGADLTVGQANGVTTDGDSNVLNFSGTSGTGRELPDGQSLDVAIQVDADNGSSGTGENLSGVLNITATQG